jgi:hypothetical protein
VPGSREPEDDEPSPKDEGVMIHEMRITRDELELLLDVLQVHQRHLANEISNTEALRAKADLRQRERAVDRLIERIRAQLEPQAQPQGA